MIQRITVPLSSGSSSQVLLPGLPDHEDKGTTILQKISGTTCPTTYCHIPDDSDFQQRQWKNLNLTLHQIRTRCH